MRFDRWRDTPDCETVKTVQALSRQNIQFQVLCEKDLGVVGPSRLNPTIAPLLLVDSPSDTELRQLGKYESTGGQVIFTHQQDWQSRLPPPDSRRISVVNGPATLRVSLRRCQDKTIVHLLNLNVQKLSSFEDKVTPAENVKLQYRAGVEPKTIQAFTADSTATSGPLEFKSTRTVTEFTVPRLYLSTIVAIE
jgi:hypothetical protein